MKVSKIHKIILTALFLLIIGMPAAYGQRRVGDQRVKGVVVDETGKIAPDVTVSIRYVGHYSKVLRSLKKDFIPSSKDIIYETQTNAKGMYCFLALSPGIWQLTATHKNKTAKRQLHLELDRQEKNYKLVIKEPKVVITDVDGNEPKNKPKTAEELYDLGKRLLEHDKNKKAIICLKLAAEKKPMWPKPYLKLGYSYFNLGELDEALKYWRTFLRLAPQSPEAETIRDMVESLQE